MHAESGYIAIRQGKSKNARRNLSLTARAAEVLKARKGDSKPPWVFPGDSPGAPILGTSLDRQHNGVRDNLKLSEDFVVHSLRNYSGRADAFTIMRIAGHSSVTVSQRSVHPAPEGMERAFERMEELNGLKFAQADAEAAAASGAQGVVKKMIKVKNGRPHESAQVFEFTRRALSSAVRAADS